MPEQVRVAKTALVALVLWSRFGFRGLNWRAWKTLTAYPGIGIVYNRIKKNANTTTILLLREIETGEIETRQGAKMRHFTWSNISYSEIFALRKRCFLVVVRNPYSRVLSAFLNKLKSEKYRQQHGKFDLTPAGFEAFVNWLATGNLDKNGHWREQTHHLFMPLRNFDAVIRFENLKPEMLSFLASRGLSAPDGRLDSLYPSDIKKRTSADAKLHQFYTPRIASIVAELYAKDFEALGYSTAFPAKVPGSAEPGRPAVQPEQ